MKNKYFLHSYGQQKEESLTLANLFIWNLIVFWSFTPNVYKCLGAFKNIEIYEYVIMVYQLYNDIIFCATYLYYSNITIKTYNN